MKFSHILVFCLIAIAAISCVEVKQKPVFQSNEAKVLVQNSDAEKAIANAAVENFHRLFNEKKNQEIFELIDVKSQLRQDKVYMVLWMEKLHRALGKFESASLTNEAVFKKDKTFEVRFEFI